MNEHVTVTVAPSPVTPATVASPPVASPPTVEEYAVVEEVNHPLAVLRGFPTIIPGEIVTFENGVLGQVMAFSTERVEVMVFDSKPVEVGSSVSRTKNILSFPVGDQVLGCLLDPLGRSIMGKKLPDTDDCRPLDNVPVPLSERRRITRRLHTGVSLADMLLPIGQGQRELVVGDRKTGKSGFVITAATSQVVNDSIIVYASIGKKAVEIKQIFETFQKSALLNKIVMIASTASDPVSTIVQTPYAAMAVSEYFRDQGKNVLVILDDLSQHAKFYRELSLLARHFPGRDSYPGNIFSIHAQLLERAGCFRNPKKAGESVSITCLPLAETTDSDLTEYIVSNLISITDGHLLFDNSLFQQGQRPAVHTALSVTRVGKQTQTPLEREVSRNLAAFMTKYEKIKELTHFGNELSEASQEIIKQGTTMSNFLAQPSRVILPITLQHIMVGVVWLGWIKQNDKSSVNQVVANLQSAYDSNPEIKTRIHKVLATEKFATLLENIDAERSFISTLCKI